MGKIASCRGALALELTPGTAAGQVTLAQDVAGALAALVSRDLAKFVPEAANLDLALIAAAFDPVELLRPGWPLHGELDRLIAQAPDAPHARVIAFAGADGVLPEALRPQAEYAQGPLRLVPWLLRGDAGRVASVAAQLEQSLLEIGMAGADTALLAQQAFAARIEHARYLTVHDLAAMMALQYEHVGLGALWPLIEAALLTPGQEQWLDAPPEPLVRLGEDGARIALIDAESWARSAWAPASTDGAALDRAFDRYQMRQRQIAAVLEAHGIGVCFDHCPPGADPRSALQA